MGAQVQCAVKAKQNSSIKPANAGLLQRQCSYGQHPRSGLCDEFHEKNSILHRVSDDPAPNIVPPIVHEALKSPGIPLDSGIRAFMELRLGHDFSGVRVHDSTKAAKSAEAMNALAYTLGHDIVFGAGQYAPYNIAGQKLMAHELTHVIQQGGIRTYPNEDLRVSVPSDNAERLADKVASVVVSADDIQYQSPALQIRHQLRSSSLTHPFIQRAINTWGGKFETDKYDLTKDPGMDGVNIELKFKPNKNVNAKKIGMVQTARSLVKGSPISTALFGAAAGKALKSRTILSGKPGAGTRVDQLSTHGNPLYATVKPGAKDSLSTTPTNPLWGYHGYHYIDKAGKLKKHDALLKDEPQLFSTMKDTSQTFETTALAVEGVQVGTFYGSVQWGWQKDLAGKVKKLPLKLISKDVPSLTFARASNLWNIGKTSEYKPTIDLPIIKRKYANTEGVWLVGNPSSYQTSIIGKLVKNTRLEVTNRGMSEPFNKAAKKNKWWKVTVADGIHVGKVGWIEQALLSDNKVK